MASLRAVLIAFLALLAALAAAAYAGLYDVGADAPHWRITEELIEWTRERSIDVRARGIDVPDLDDPRLVADGAEHYAAMCVGCHLAPGVEETEIYRGLYPAPPKLAEPWPANPAEQFWVIKHGIKATAMPAWGATHSDEALWALVAFLRKLQGMTAEEYSALTQPAAREEQREAPTHHHDHGDKDHHHD